VQTPETHVWFVHATTAPHTPFAPHVSTPLPEHCVAPVEGHVPVHWPREHDPLAHATGLPHWPHALHSSSALPEHWEPPGAHVGAAGQEHVPCVQLAVHACVP
jgi:hypothetical protein